MDEEILDYQIEGKDNSIETPLGKKFKWVEGILIGFCIVALAFRILHFNLLAFSILPVLCLFLFWIVSAIATRWLYNLKETGRAVYWFLGLATVYPILVFLGMLFRLQSWPFSYNLLIGGLAIGFCSAIGLFVYIIRAKETKSRSFLISMLIKSGAKLVLVFIFMQFVVYHF